VCGNRYVESLDPLAGKEEAERKEALRGRKGEVRAHAHRTNVIPQTAVLSSKVRLG
jgi:hypothetical protein